MLNDIQGGPDTEQWTQEIFHEKCILNEVILKLQNEQSEINDMYGTLSIASKNYEKIIHSLKKKNEELSRRLKFVVTKGGNE